MQWPVSPTCVFGGHRERRLLLLVEVYRAVRPPPGVHVEVQQARQRRVSQKQHTAGLWGSSSPLWETQGGYYTADSLVKRVPMAVTGDAWPRQWGATRLQAQLGKHCSEPGAAAVASSALSHGYQLNLKLHALPSGTG